MLLITVLDKYVNKIFIAIFFVFSLSCTDDFQTPVIFKKNKEIKSKKMKIGKNKNAIVNIDKIPKPDFTNASVNSILQQVFKNKPKMLGYYISNNLDTFFATFLEVIKNDNKCRKQFKKLLKDNTSFLKLLNLNIINNDSENDEKDDQNYDNSDIEMDSTDNNSLDFNQNKLSKYLKQKNNIESIYKHEIDESRKTKKYHSIKTKLTYYHLCFKLTKYDPDIKIYCDSKYFNKYDNFLISKSPTKIGDYKKQRKKGIELNQIFGANQDKIPVCLYFAFQEKNLKDGIKEIIIDFEDSNELKNKIKIELNKIIKD